MKRVIRGIIGALFGPESRSAVRYSTAAPSGVPGDVSPSGSSMVYIETKKSKVCRTVCEKGWAMIAIRARPEAVRKLLSLPEHASITLVVDGDIIDSVIEEE